MELKKQELIKIEGGLSITGTLINAFSRGINIILDVGRSLGSSIRRMYENKCCSL